MRAAGLDRDMILRFDLERGSVRRINFDVAAFGAEREEHRAFIGSCSGMPLGRGPSAGEKNKRILAIGRFGERTGNRKKKSRPSIRGVKTSIGEQPALRLRRFAGSSRFLRPWPLNPAGLIEH